MVTGWQDHARGDLGSEAVVDDRKTDPAGRESR